MARKNKNFRGESLEQVRQQIIDALRASRSWLGAYAEAYVDDFELMAHDRLQEVFGLEDAAEKLEALKEVGPVLSECRWFLVDMHIWPPETTVAVSVDLLPKVDAVIVKAHAALGHPASTTSDIGGAA